MVEDPIEEVVLNDSISESSELEPPMEGENQEITTSQIGLISVHSIGSSVEIFRKKCQERHLREDELKRAVDAYRCLLLMNAEHQSYLIAIDSVRDLLAQNYPSIFHLVGFVAGVHGYIDKWKIAANKCQRTLAEFSSFISGFELNDINTALHELETCQTKLKEATATFQNAIVAEERKQTELKENLAKKVIAVNAQLDTNRLAKERVTKNIKEATELEEYNRKLREAVLLKKSQYQELELSICGFKEKDEEILRTISEKKEELEVKRASLTGSKTKMDEIAKKRQERENYLNRVRDEYKESLEITEKEYNEVIQQNLAKIATEDSAITEQQREEEFLSIELRKLTKELEEKKVLKDKLMRKKDELIADVTGIKKKNALLLARQMEEAAKKEEERKAAEALAEKKRIQKEKRLAKKKEKEALASQEMAVTPSKTQKSESLSHPLEESFVESQGSDSDYEALVKMKRRGRKKGVSKVSTKIIDDEIVPSTRPKRQSAQTAIQRTKSFLAEDENDDDMDIFITSIVSPNDNPLASSTDEAVSSPKKGMELGQAVDLQPSVPIKTPDKPNKSETSGNKTPKKVPVVEKTTASQIIKNMNTPIKKPAPYIDTPRPGNITKNSMNASKKPLISLKVPEPIS
ncbi:hypothetical protein FO519_008451 [Halicephalobus sp. NKZ332]|nr:hypothetical protein FO519_008451 [Halicephalobus sp. NKZ332]